MNYSRTYSHSNGAGMNRTNINGSQSQSGSETGSHAEQQSPQKETSRQERRDGFTMFRPDEKKRMHLAEVAKRETEEANARSEARRPRHIHERPRRVGGTAEHSTAINQKQKAVTAASKGLEMQRKREKWQREKRESEEKELQEKKTKAREQAERNEVLRVVRNEEMMERHREAHRWKNQAFLDKLEQRNSYSGY